MAEKDEVSKPAKPAAAKTDRPDTIRPAGDAPPAPPNIDVSKIHVREPGATDADTRSSVAIENLKQGEAPARGLANPGEGRVTGGTAGPSGDHAGPFAGEFNGELAGRVVGSSGLPLDQAKVESSRHNTSSRQTLTEEKLSTMSNAEIAAVAHDRGYENAGSSGKRSRIAKFLAAQKEDTGLEKENVGEGAADPGIQTEKIQAKP